MDFFDRVKESVKNGPSDKRTTIQYVVEKAGISLARYNSARRDGRILRADEAVALAQELDTTVEWLVTGKESKNNGQNMLVKDNTLVYRDSFGRQVPVNGDLIIIPILSQKVAAGYGQAMVDDVEVVGQLPFLSRMLRGSQPAGAKALEVRGDSMTGVNIFDGDLVVFIPGVIRGDGIYVLAVGDELIVKRVEFDPVSRKIRIMSENPRYQDRVESADGQTVRIVGKVFGWVHAHPY